MGDDALRSQLEQEAAEIDRLARVSEEQDVLLASKANTESMTRRSRGKGTPIDQESE